MPTTAKPAKERILWHGTSAIALENILKTGLIPHGSTGADAYAKTQWGIDFTEQAKTNAKNHPKQREHSVFLTEEEVHAGIFARYAAKVTQSEPVILKIIVPPNGVKPRSIHADEYSGSDLDKRFEGTIPPEWITVKAKGEAQLPPLPPPQFNLFDALMQMLDEHDRQQ